MHDTNPTDAAAAWQAMAPAERIARMEANLSAAVAAGDEERAEGIRRRIAAFHEGRTVDNPSRAERIRRLEVHIARATAAGDEGRAAQLQARLEALRHDMPPAQRPRRQFLASLQQAAADGDLPRLREVMQRMESGLPPVDPAPSMATALIPPPVVDLRRAAAPPVAEPQASRDIRPGRLMLWLAILLPILAGAVYWGWIASPRYLSEARFTIRSDQPGAQGGGLLALASAGLPADDTRMMLAFIPTRSCMEAVDRESGILAHWRDAQWDPLSRLASAAPVEDALGHWRDRVRVRLDESGMLEVGVQAYTPEQAERTCSALVAACGRLADDLSRQLVAERTAFLDRELARARQALSAAKDDLLAFQRERGELDPMGRITSIASTVLSIDSELAQERAALAEMLSVLGDRHESVSRQRARIAALEIESGAERGRALSSSSTTAGGPMTEMAANWQALQLALQFATDVYTTALAAHAQAQAELGQKLRMVQVIDKPSLPESPAYPRFWYAMTVLILVVGALAACGSLAVTLVREHRD